MCKIAFDGVRGDRRNIFGNQRQGQRLDFFFFFQGHKYRFKIHIKTDTNTDTNTYTYTDRKTVDEVRHDRDMGGLYM